MFSAHKAVADNFASLFREVRVAAGVSENESEGFGRLPIRRSVREIVVSNVATSKSQQSKILRFRDNSKRKIQRNLMKEYIPKRSKANLND